jgi:predicted nuclease of restriction endonuclease-like RecB superfamily
LLPLELLRVRTKMGQIRPVYADLTRENLDLATALLNLFQANLEKRKGDLLDRVSNHEMAGFDYRLVRGLSLILERLCIFQVEAVVDPATARRVIFEEANKKGPVVTNEMRNHVLHAAAKQLNVTYEELEKSFQADLESELILKEFTPISPSELLKRYNLSLTQTLLFRSTFIDIRVSDHWKEVLRDIKFHGLMYSAETSDHVFRITIDGPLSLFKLTQRYGTNMAKVLPTVVKANTWAIDSSVLRASQFGKRLYQLRLKSAEVGDKIKPSSLGRRDNEVKFDSFVEEKFFKDFQSLNTGWRIIREPSPLIVGRHVFVPDFCFERNGIRIYMEIVGFWTKKYLETKLKKLQQLQGVDILIAADENLICDKLKQVKGQLIFYKGTVPLKPVLNFLKARREEQVQLEMNNLKLTSLTLRGDLVQLRKLAGEYGVSDEALRRKLKSFRMEGYTLVGDLFISNKKLKEIDLKIVSLTKPSLAQVIRLIEDEGMKKPLDILSKLDYAIQWKGLDISKSSIHKKPRTRA